MNYASDMVCWPIGKVKVGLASWACVTGNELAVAVLVTTSSALSSSSVLTGATTAAACLKTKSEE